MRSLDLRMRDVRRILCPLAVGRGGREGGEMRKVMINDDDG